MTRRYVYYGGYVNYDHTALYIVIGIIVAVMVVTLVGYAVYAYRKKKKMKEKVKEYKITFLKEEKDITKKEGGE